MRTYPLYVDGEEITTGRWCYTISADRWIDKPFETFTLKRELESGKISESPHIDAIAGRCALGIGDENKRAIEAARRAAKAYSRIPIDMRQKMLSRIHELIHARTEEWLSILIAEGHPRKLAEWEISGVTSGCRPESLAYLREQMERSFEVDGHSIRIQRKPDGVVCVNPPQNAAGSNSGMGIYCLFAGNTLVVKAPQSGPLGVHFFYREIVAPALREIGAPPGTINIVSGNSEEILAEWLNSPAVNAILFFGSSRSGIKLGRECIVKGKKSVLELSGNDSFVVWEDADLDRASSTLLECFYGSSQICMVPKHAILHPAIADRFIEAFLPKVRAVKPGYPHEPDVILSPVLKAHEFFEYLTEATAAGLKPLCGGERVNRHGQPAHDGAFIEPTVLRIDGWDQARKLKCVTEETFFPLLPLVVPAASATLFDDVVSFVNANPYGLRTSFWSTNQALIERYLAEVDNVGQFRVNESHIGFVPIISTHGGPGLTGGPYGELNFAGLRTSHLQGISMGGR